MSLHVKADFVGHQIQFKILRQELEGRRRLAARGELGRDLHHKSHTAWRWHERVFRELERVLEHDLPCTHMAFAIWKTGKRAGVFIGGDWIRNLYVYAYVTPAVNHPFIVKDELEYSTLHPPIITRRRSRPRTSRIESQAATSELEQPPKRPLTCGRCGGVGHNRRTCQAPESNE